MNNLSNQQSTFEVLLISKICRNKNFSLEFFNKFIQKNKDGSYANKQLEYDFRDWQAKKNLTGQ